MSGTSHFWSRSRQKKNLVPIPVPARKKFWSRSRSRREKVLSLGPGPFRNKFWCRSQSKIFWSRSRSKKTILALVLFRKHFGTGPNRKKFWSPVPVKKKFWSRSKKNSSPGLGPSQKKIWSRDRDWDHFAHLYSSLYVIIIKSAPNWISFDMHVIYNTYIGKWEYPKH